MSSGSFPLESKATSAPSSPHPPFSQASAPNLPDWRLALPAIVWVNRGSLILPREDISAWFSKVLCTPKLLNIREWLWLAGLPRPARPLHRQRLIGRQFLITEDPNEHLVWDEHTVFIKPLPAFLLSTSAWEEHLCPSQDEGNDVYASACGLLLSYTWLIQHPIDFSIAQQESLLPPDLSWHQWVIFVTSFSQEMSIRAWETTPRYQYSELRLSRLSSICRFHPLTFSFNNISRGFMPIPTWYRAFFLRNFQWLVAVFAYVTVTLSALQVGLSTPQLRENSAFTKASYGFAVASIMSTVFVVVAIVVTWSALFWWHLLSTLRYVWKVRGERGIKAGV